ncbi:MAG: Gfo/Idh/MocA family oxidoreductase [Clostridia bacterium]|nr:Gfo/Idh/MocA family oxidoreductase [Clostridia bacterium]
MKKLRWGVLGAGGIADRRTIPAMMNCENAELVAVMEINPEFAEKLRAKYNAKRAYTDAQALVNDPEVDAVYIASPVVLHAEQIRMCADAGKHILCEKPLAGSPEISKAALQYCYDKNVRIATGLMMRFNAGVQAMKKALADGKIGDLVSATLHFTCWYPDIPGAWRQTKATAGGGAMTDMGVHMIDLLRYISGQEVKRVAAMHETNTFSYEVEDSSCAILQLENGALCTIHTNFNIPDAAAKWRIELYGNRGRLIGDNVVGQEDMGSVEMISLESVGGYDAVQNTDLTKPELLPLDLGNAYQREIESFSDSILNNKPLEVPAEAAIAAQEIIEASYKSNETNTTIVM